MEIKVGWRVGNSHWEWMGSGGTYRWAIKDSFKKRETEERMGRGQTGEKEVESTQKGFG